DQRANAIDYGNWPALLDLGVIPVRPATYVSILVPRASLERHGLPLAPMFMWGDDTEFTLRISQEAPGYLVAASKVRHLRRVSGTIDIRRETDPARIALHRHFIRNEFFVARRYAGSRRVASLMVSRTLLVVRLIKAGQFAKAKIVLQGLREAFGFDPRVEAADAPLEALGVSVRQLSPVVSVLDQAWAGSERSAGGEPAGAAQADDRPETPAVASAKPRGRLGALGPRRAVERRAGGRPARDTRGGFGHAQDSGLRRRRGGRALSAQPGGQLRPRGNRLVARGTRHHLPDADRPGAGALPAG